MYYFVQVVGLKFVNKFIKLIKVTPVTGHNAELIDMRPYSRIHPESYHER